MSQAYISIGSNIDRARNVCFSIEALATRYGALQLSSVYESDAIGFESAARMPARTLIRRPCCC